MYPVCTNAYIEDEYKSKEYEEDKKRVHNFLDAFDYKAEFAKVVMQEYYRQVYYTWFRKNKMGQ